MHEHERSRWTSYANISGVYDNINGPARPFMPGPFVH